MRREAKNLFFGFGRRAKMKHIATVGRRLNPGVAVAYAQQTPVTMTFSGTGASRAIHLKQPNTTAALLLLWKAALAAALCAAAFSKIGLAQVPPASILQIDVANNVRLIRDLSG